MQRVGIIIPSSNVVVEDTLLRHAAQLTLNVRYHIARISVVSVNLDDASVDQFQETAMNDALGQLCEAHVDSIVFAGTAGAWLGIDRERAWCDNARVRTGIKVTSTTLLALNALHATGATRIGLVSPFRSDIHQKIIENFESERISITNSRFLGLELSRDMANISTHSIAELIRDCLDEGCETVLCFCSNLRGMDACVEVSASHQSAILLDSVALTLQAISPTS
jgi:maleate isomerase